MVDQKRIPFRESQHSLASKWICSCGQSDVRVFLLLLVNLLLTSSEWTISRDILEGLP